jgi:hypothetical protein
MRPAALEEAADARPDPLDGRAGVRRQLVEADSGRDLPALLDAQVAGEKRALRSSWTVEAERLSVLSDGPVARVSACGSCVRTPPSRRPPLEENRLPRARFSSRVLFCGGLPTSLGASPASMGGAATSNFLGGFGRTRAPKSMSSSAPKTSSRMRSASAWCRWAPPGRKGSKPLSRQARETDSPRSLKARLLGGRRERLHGQGRRRRR